MPFEIGGLADKLGNRYEDHWLATKLISLLNEKILSVTVEAIGDDEKGVDLWIAQKNGVRQAHQCKARNASTEYWSISDLAARGVLGNLKYQLDRDPSHEFYFVSSVGSELFKDICEFARRSDNKPNIFYQKKILSQSSKVQTCFKKFCGYISLNPDEESDRVRAFHYLKRTYITVYPDDQGTWQNLLDLTDSLLIGEPEIVVSTLLTYAQNNNRFGSPIYADELRKFLSKNGIYLKRLAHDSRIAPAIEVLQREFAESIHPQLIGGVPIQRNETSLLIDAIKNGQNVVLSGAAGYGKSGVLFELTEHLQHEKIPYLPIRLDRREPENTAAQFGLQMGLPDCPAFSLAAFAGERQSVLILDQLDAIRFAAEEVRFHIKHLVLELIGSLEEMSEELVNYCLSLLEDDFWKEHILETVFIGHTPYILFLCDKGIIGQWLDSKSDDNVNRARWLLRSVADKVPDAVAELIEPYIEKGGAWPGRLSNILAWKIHGDSDHMFQIRLKLARQKEYPSFVDWKALCKKHSYWAVQLIEAVLSTWNVDDDESKDAQKDRHEKWYDKDIKAINKVVIDFPKETWDLLLPHIERLTHFESDQYDSRQDKWRVYPYRENRSIKFARGVVELTSLAGKKLAKDFPKDLLQRTQSLEASTSPVIQEILAETYKYLPSEYAEQGISWLLIDTARFRLGSGLSESEWQPAARLVQALSPYCSEELFRRLEGAIVHYHAPNEKQSAEYWLRTWKEGYFGHYWGKTQHFLLPALPPTRIQPSTTALITVLQRKFSGYSEDRFLKIGRSRGGLIDSKLTPNLEKISDRAWLDIVRNPKVENPNCKGWIQITPDRVIETSVGQFSSSLRIIAKRYPERFARLALRFPGDVDSAYIAAVLDACGQKAPDSNFSEEMKFFWEPAKSTTVEAVLEKFQAENDRETAASFCRLISERYEENWSDATLTKLVHYAQNHPDLEPGKLNIYCDTSAIDEASVDMLFQNTTTCIRGKAARAIERLLWEHPELLEKLRPGIEALVRDHHPVARMAATEMLLSVLNIDKDQAVEWFVVACEKDLRVAASPRGITFYNYTIPSHIDHLAPIIQKMIFSPWDDVSQEGARQVTARWLYNSYFEKEFATCQSGTVPQRQGVAKVAVQLLNDRVHSETCQKILQPLFNDPNNCEYFVGWLLAGRLSVSLWMN